MRTTKVGRWLSVFVIALIAITLIVGGCSKAATPAPNQTPAPADAVTVKTVRVSDAGFEPSILAVTKGETVKLTVVSRDTSHTFTIDELEINIDVGAGQTATKEFTVDKAGTFAFYCAVPGHRDAGEKGNLWVTE